MFTLPFYNRYSVHFYALVYVYEYACVWVCTQVCVCRTADNLDYRPQKYCPHPLR